MECKTEEWRPVVGFEEKYEVSDMGRVRSIDRVVQASTGPQHWPAKMLQPYIDKSNGYLYVNLARGGAGGGAKKSTVHTVVLTAFRGAVPPGMEGCHEDGDRTNAALANLRWDTRPNNAADRRRHGTHRSSAKLTLEQVAEIRASVGPSHVVAARYGVASSTIRAIRIGQNWAETIPSSATVAPTPDP